MVQVPHVEELRAIEPILSLRALGVVKGEVAVPHRTGVAPAGRRGRTKTAVRIETESARDLRRHSSQIQAGANDLRVFDLVDLCRAALVPARLKGTEWSEAARIADFVAKCIKTNAAVAGQQLRIGLRVLIAKGDVVECVDRA